MAWLDKAPTNLGTLDRTMRWLQCLLGTLTALIYALVALRAFGSMPVAVGTGLLCALHPLDHQCRGNQRRRGSVVFYWGWPSGWRARRCKMARW